MKLEEDDNSGDRPIHGDGRVHWAPKCLGKRLPRLKRSVGKNRVAIVPYETVPERRDKNQSAGNGAEPSKKPLRCGCASCACSDILFWPHGRQFAVKSCALPVTH